MKKLSLISVLAIIVMGPFAQAEGTEQQIQVPQAQTLQIENPAQRQMTVKRADNKYNISIDPADSNSPLKDPKELQRVLKQLQKQAEGNSGGGGTPVESGFKTAVLKRIRTAKGMTGEQKKVLEFDPDTVWVKLNIPNGFMPVCAQGKVLNSIRKEVKMARVYPELTSVVFLNCTDHKYEKWRELFNSTDEANDVFFIHEANRVAQVENENDYSASASFLEALRAAGNYEDLVKARTMEALFSEYDNGKCRLLVWKTAPLSYIAADGTRYGRHQAIRLSMFSNHNNTPILDETLGTVSLAHGVNEVYGVTDGYETELKMQLFSTTDIKPKYRDLRDKIYSLYQTLASCR